MSGVILKKVEAETNSFSHSQTLESLQIQHLLEYVTDIEIMSKISSKNFSQAAHNTHYREQQEQNEKWYF